MWEYCNREGICLTGTVQYFGIDFRKRFRNLGRMRMEKGGKCNQRTSIIKKTNVFAHKYIIEGTREGLEMVSGPWTCLEWQCLGSATVAGAGREEAVGECCWQQAGLVKWSEGTKAAREKRVWKGTSWKEIRGPDMEGLGILLSSWYP